MRETIRRKLLSWYDENRRTLPWRDQGSAYAVWVSEVMLQQTRVEVVRDYYARWMKSFPTIADLARASEDEVLRHWQGLGYYSRAKRLRGGAQFVLERFSGTLPKTPAELETIPGIGPYSAGAISSIAFGEAAPLVDGNVIRVLTRWFALEGDPNKALLKKELWRLAADLVSPSRPGDFNQGLMELGALVCTPKSPSCIACPLRTECRAHRLGRAQDFPQLPKRSPPTELSMIVFLLQKRGRLGVLTLPPDAPWWAGLSAFPFARVPHGEDPRRTAEDGVERYAAGASGPRALPVVRHSVTRFKIHLHPFEFDVRRRTDDSLRWMTPAELQRSALPAPHMKALRQRR